MVVPGKIMVIGACGQIGTELTLALRNRYGGTEVIAADLKRESDLLKGTGPYLPLDIMDRTTLQIQVRRHGVKTIYLLAAMLSANNPTVRASRLEPTKTGRKFAFLHPRLGP